VTRTDAGRPGAPQTEPDASRGLRGRLRVLEGGTRLAPVVLLLAAAAGLVLVAGEFLKIFSVTVGGASCEAVASPDVADFCSTTGLERHSGALVVLGLFTLAMAWGATGGRSRPAGAALLLVGGTVLAIAVLGDLPHVFSEGVIGARYAEAKASPGLGFWFELAGGALALAAGVLRLSRPG
jgi:hypothetical protein